MARNVTPENDKSRLIAKTQAMAICADVITKIARNSCFTLREYSLAVPEGKTAEEIAAAVGGILVGTTTGKVFGGVAQRIAIVRISVGLLTSSIVDQAAVRAGAIAFEQVAVPVSGGAVQALAKTTMPVLNGAPTVQKFVQAATIEQQSAANIIGETAQFSKATIVFTVVGFLLQSLIEWNKANSAEARAQFEENRRQLCCEALGKAGDAAWKNAPKVFHDNALKTGNVPRFYAIKSSRKN